MKRAWILCILVLAAVAEAQEDPSGVYQILPEQSKISAEVGTGGVLGFMGHPHLITAGTFKGTIQVSTEEPGKSSLDVVVIAGTLEEKGEFNEKDLNTINTKMKDEVLEVSKYPEISFKSTKVDAKLVKEGEYKALIEGDLTIRGVSRPITLPVTVHISNGSLHAAGTFQFLRDNFSIKTDSAGGGTVKVAKEVKISFNILAIK